MYERLQAFLEAGIDIVRSLESIRDRYAKTQGMFSRFGAQDFRAKIMTQWIEEMRRGAKFEGALREWIPSNEHMLISAGERGEGLIKGLKEATTMSQAAARTKSAIIGGTLYPLALIAMMLSMLYAFQTKQVPIFTGLLPVESWPQSGRLLYNLSWFVVHRLWLVVGGMIAISFLVSFTMGRWRGRIRTVFDKLPPWSVYRSYQASSFMIGLASLMRAGIPNFDALRLMQRNASPWMKDHLSRMMAAMSLGGANQGAALDTGLLDPETAGDVQDYSRLGSFRDAIHTLGERALESGVKAIESKMIIVKNILLFAVVAQVGWIYMTTYLLQADIANRQSQVNSSIRQAQ